MDLLGHKLVALFLILVTISVSTALPIKVSAWFLRKGRIGRRIISAVMCFGGGFFLGTLLLHTLPEVVELTTLSLNVPYNIDFPLGYFFVGCGFFMMLFVEKAVLDLVQWNDRRKAAQKVTREIVVNEDGQVKETSVQNGVVRPTQITLPDRDGQVNQGLEHHGEEWGGINPSGEVVEAADGHGHGHGHSHEEEAGHSHVHGSAAKSFVLLLALSIDCVFEGLSLGLQFTIHGVWQMVLAILSHEIVVAFGLGLQLTKHNSPMKALVMAIVYGITCPVGIAIGLIINESAADAPGFDITFGILLGITGGVFLYVTFIEILMHEFVHEMRMVNILAVLLGYGIMAAIMGSGAHQHEHAHSGGDGATTGSYFYRHFGII